jgi:hypothetical protein
MIDILLECLFRQDTQISNVLRSLGSRCGKQSLLSDALLHTFLLLLNVAGEFLLVFDKLSHCLLQLGYLALSLFNATLNAAQFLLGSFGTLSDPSQIFLSCSETTGATLAGAIDLLAI